MKNTFVLSGLLMSLIFISSLNAQNERRIDFTLQGGYNIIKTVKSGHEKYETKNWIPTIYFETHIYLSKKNAFFKNLGLGVGLSFYTLKSEDTDIGWLYTYPGEEGSLYWWPLYLSIKYNLPVNDNFIPYLKVDNGYTFFSASENIINPDNMRSYQDVWGGYYLSLSGGIIVAKFITFELNYSLLNSGFSNDYGSPGYWSYSEDKFKTKMLTLSVGVCF